MSKRKVLSGVLSFMMAISLLAGCQGSGSKDDATAKNASGNNTTADESWQSPTEGSGGIALPISKEPLEYTYMMYEVGAYPYEDSHIIWPELERRTNIKIKPIVVPVDSYTSRVTVTMAAGSDLPDLINTSDAALLNNYGNTGRIVNLLDYIDSMPNFQKITEKMNLDEVKFDKEHQYFLPLRLQPPESHRDGMSTGWLVRRDILQKHGIEEPKTMDELYEMLKKLKELYPDSEPWTSRAKFIGIINNISLSFGFQCLPQGNYVYDRETNTAKYAAEDSRFKEAVAFMSKCYQEHLLDREVITNTVQKWEERMISGTSFLTFDWGTRTDFFVNVARQKGDNEYYLGLMAPPAVDGVTGMVDSAWPFNSRTAVTSGAKELEKLIAFLDYAFYSRDGTVLTRIGIEGQTFRWTNTEKTRYEYIPQPDIPMPDVTNMGNKFGIGTGRDAVLGAHLIQFGIESAVPIPDVYETESKRYIGRLLPPAPRAYFTHEEVEAQIPYGGLNDFFGNQINQIIIGMKSMDVWDEIVEGCKKRGSKEMTDYINNSLSRQTK